LRGSLNAVHRAQSWAQEEKNLAALFLGLLASSDDAGEILFTLRCAVPYAGRRVVDANSPFLTQTQGFVLQDE
jgi:hypothetical protein